MPPLLTAVAHGLPGTSLTPGSEKSPGVDLLEPVRGTGLT